MTILSEIIERSDWSARTKEEYARCVQRFEAFAGPADSWAPLRVEEWRDALRAEGLSSSTVNKHLYALRYASKRYATLKYGPDFAAGAEALRGAATNAHRRKALTVEEVQAMLDTCTGYGPRPIRDRAILQVAVKTGLRVSGMASLDWARVRGNVLIAAEKGDRIAGAILDDEAMVALEAWVAALESLGEPRTGSIFRGIGQQRINGSWYLWPGMSRQAIYGVIVQRAADAGITRRVHTHLFRHTFVSWALEAGVPPERVMAATGHKNLATLSRYYTDLQAESDPVANYLPRLNR